MRWGFLEAAEMKIFKFCVYGISMTLGVFGAIIVLSVGGGLLVKALF